MTCKLQEFKTSRETNLNFLPQTISPGVSGEVWLTRTLYWRTLPSQNISEGTRNMTETTSCQLNSNFSLLTTLRDFAGAGNTLSFKTNKQKKPPNFSALLVVGIVTY